MKKVIIFFILFIPLCIGAERPVIKIAAVEMPPIISNTETQPSFSIELITKVFDKCGYDVRFDFINWARGYQDTKIGNYDAIYPSIYTKERGEQFYFSTVIFKTKYVLIKRKDSKINFESIKDLKPYTIGVLRGGVTGSDEFNNASYLSKEPGTTFEENIKKLYGKRVDLITGEYYSIKKIIDEKFPEYKQELDVMDKPLGTTEFMLMFSKNSNQSQKAIKLFNKYFEVIKNDGTYDSLMKKYKM